MAFDYIKEDELKTTFEDAKKFMLPLHQPFDEFERIARNKPHPGIDKNLPKVTDGTLAALIKEQPKRVIQQIPTASVKSKDDWLEIVASYIFQNVILPNSNETAALIQKCWALVTKALTYGSQPAYVQFINRGDYFGTDFTLPYIKDVFLEPGKLSDLDSNVMFLRSWWTKNQIQAIIDKQKGLSDKAKARKEEYKSNWDLDKLAQMIETKPGEKDSNAQTPAEKNKMLNAGFYEIVHVFQRGVGGTFYSFDPKQPDGDNVLRSRVNKDPRGVIPIHFMYADIDFSNPLGRGAIELSGGLQNLLDSEMQMYQYNRALMLNPPIIKKGAFPKSRIVFAPNKVIDIGSDVNASVEAMNIDTTAIANFPNNYGLIKSQILNLNSSTDTSVSAEVGNPGFSKTDAGVKANDVKLGISDNYVRKQFENVFGEIGETELNLYFAERAGIQKLQVDDETAAKLKRIRPDSVNANNEIRIDYSGETEIMDMEIDASSSGMKDDTDQFEKAQTLLEMTQQFPTLDSKQGGPIDVTELADRAVTSIGLEDPEKIVNNERDADGNLVSQGQQQQPSMTPEMVQQMIQEAIKANDANDLSNHPVVKLMESLQIKFTDLGPNAQNAILAQLDLPPDEASPSTVDTALKVNQQNIDQSKVDQTAIDSANQHKIDAANTAVKIAGLSHQEKTASASNELATADQALRAKQANKKPVGATK